MHILYSIRSRLIFSYSFAAMILLTIVVALLYWVTVSEIARHVSLSNFVTHERKLFILIFTAGAFFAFLSASIATGLGLRRLDALTRTVEEISAHSLDQRVIVSSLPKDLRPLGKAFNQMLERIEDSFSRLKQLSDDLSHELNTPVTNLIMQTEILLALPDLSLRSREAITSNLEELQRLSSLIKNILFLARTDNTNQIEKFEVIAEKEISKICEYYQPICDEKQLIISIEGSAVLQFNPPMFTRLLTNIISNAVKYTPNQGKINILISQDDDKTQFTIKDNGIGIDENDLPYVSNRFYRSNLSRSLEKRGVGLGLAMAYSIVKLHQGEIHIESAINIGTEVKLMFSV